jgi:hypothetical protein
MLTRRFELDECTPVYSRARSVYKNTRHRSDVNESVAVAGSKIYPAPAYSAVRHCLRRRTLIQHDSTLIQETGL